MPTTTLYILTTKFNNQFKTYIQVANTSMPSRIKLASAFIFPNFPQITAGLSRYPASTLLILFAFACFPFLRSDYRTYLSYDWWPTL